MSSLLWSTKSWLLQLLKSIYFLGLSKRYLRLKSILPSRKNVRTFLDEVRDTVKGNKQAKTGNLIALLNPLIRGWANYHRCVCSKKTYTSIDNAIPRVREGRLQTAVAMGKEETSQRTKKVDQGEVFQIRKQQKLDLLWRNHRWQGTPSHHPSSGCWLG